MVKRRSCRFIDDEADEEDEEGFVLCGDDVASGDQCEDVATAEDLKFIDDEEYEDVLSECSEVRDSEKELDDEDLLQLEDNRRANRVSRISRVADSSDSDSFIEDDIGMYGQYDSDYGTSCDEEPRVSVKAKAKAKAKEKAKSLKIYVPKPNYAPIIKIEPNASKTSDSPKALFSPNASTPQFPKLVNKVTFFREPTAPEVAKPVANWDFMKAVAPVSKAAPKKNANVAPKKKAKSMFHFKPLSGMVRNSDGLFFIGKDGNRVKVENGNVMLNP